MNVFTLLAFVQLVSSCLLPSTYGWQTTTIPTSRSARGTFHNIKKSRSNTMNPSLQKSTCGRLFFLRLPALTPEVVVDEEEEAAVAWTKNRLHNSGTFRSAAVLAVVFAAGSMAGSANSALSVPSLPAKFSGILHILSFGTWFGTVAYTTFILGITMFKNLPRQTFGKLQAKLFPKYFALCSLTLILQIITIKSLHLISLPPRQSQKALVVSLIMTLLNQFYLEPMSTRNMMERYTLEDAGEETTDKYKRLRKRFGKFHGMSSLTNLIALLGGIAHACSLGAALV